MLPTVSDARMAEDLLALVDGVIFSGGPDLDPSYYGETLWNGTVKVDTLRDASDLLLMHAALSSGKPILSICRGEQLMNVVLGGSLVQDIPSQIGEDVVHSGGALHPVSVEKGSLLYGFFGQETLLVNSFHHQAVKEPGAGVRITARSADGLVEAYEYGNQVLSVQFHPEGMARTDPAWLVPFRYLVRRCLLADQ